MGVNDTVAMRKACQKMLDLLMPRGDGKTRCVLTWDEFNESQKMLRAALAAPARNCDVGTPKEQSERFEAFCDSHWDLNNDDGGCSGCPLKKIRDGSGCEFAWMQMPYEGKEESDGQHQ